MSLLLFESTTPPPRVCLSTPGAQGDLHSRQAQVCCSISLPRFFLVHQLYHCAILINPFFRALIGGRVMAMKRPVMKS